MHLPFAPSQDYERPTNLYKEQPPLRLPNMNFATSSVQASVSPRFESLLGRSNSVAWSPAPVDQVQHENSSDLMSGSRKYNSKVADSWAVNNAESKTSDLWAPSQTQARQADVWSPNDNQSQTQPKRSDVWSPTYTQSQNRRSELWSPSLIQAKIPEEPRTKTTTNTMTKTMDTTAFSQNSSNLPMLKRSGTKQHPCRERYDHHSVSLSSTETAPNPTCCQKWCSPRCKLGALGFVIGLLAVAIPLAVILVLWLRQ